MANEMIAESEFRGYAVLDLGATISCIHREQPQTGTSITIGTLNGDIIATQTTSAISLRTTQGTARIIFERAAESSDFGITLLSLSQMAQNGWDASFREMYITDPHDNKYRMHIVNNLFCVELSADYHDDTITVASAPATRHKAFTAAPLNGMRLLHNRLAHFSEAKIMESIRHGARFGPHAETATINDRAEACDACMQGKAREPAKKRVKTREATPGALVHADIKGPVETSADGHRYFIHFTDDACSFVRTYALRRKSEANDALKMFIDEATPLGHTIRAIRCDNDSVLVQGEMSATLKASGIQHQPIPAYDPKAGGRHENPIGVIWHGVQALMFAARRTVPFKYWHYGLRVVTNVRNNIFSTPTQQLPSIPWLGAAEDLSHLFTFGCVIYRYVPKQLRKAHEPRAAKCIYLGHRNKHIAYVLDPVSGTVSERGHILKAVEHILPDNTIVDFSLQSELRVESPAEGGALPDGEDTTAHAPAEGGASSGQRQGHAPDEGGASSGQTPVTNRASHTRFSWHQQHMLTDHEWERLNKKYSFNYEACSSDDGRNARLSRRSSPSNPFEKYDGAPTDRIFLNPPFDNAQAMLTHAETLFKRHPTMEITAVVPDWREIDTTRWEVAERINKSTRRVVFQHPSGVPCGEIQWDVLVLRLSKDAGAHLMDVPRMFNKSLKLQDISIDKLDTYHDGDTIQAVAHIRTGSHGRMNVFLTPLLTYYPETWKMVTDMNEREDHHPTILHRTTSDKWPGWTGLITGFDPEDDSFEIAYYYADSKTVQFDVIPVKECKVATSHKVFVSLKPEEADTNPRLVRENQENIYIPENSRDLFKMKPGPLKSLFMEAFLKELGNYREQNVYRLAYLPKGRKAVGSRAVCELKWDKMTGMLDKAKVRIVGQGFSQVYGVDFTETYASTPKLSTMRYFIWVAVNNQMTMSEWDVTAAYLHSALKEDIYLRPPYGAEEYDQHGNLLYWLLLKSIYGLRQSGHNWMEDLFKFMKDYGMTQSQSDTSLFELYRDGRLVLIVFIHTDDGKCAYRDANEYQRFLSALKSKFNIGAEKTPIDRMFNVKINYLDDGTILLNQEQYIRNLCKTYNLVIDPNVDAPMSSGYVVDIPDVLSPKQIEQMKTRPFLSLLSALMWLSRCCRPDIALALTVLSRASARPHPAAWTALIRVLKYLANTAAWGIHIYSCDDHVCRIWSDASHANDPTTLRSISGHYICIGPSMIDWNSRHQPYVSLHSGEAEVIAGAVAAQHALYWIQLSGHAASSSLPVELYVDSTTAETFLSNPIHTTSMKHIRTKLFFVRELVASRVFSIYHISGLDNPADMLTKPLGRDTLIHLFRNLVARGGGSDAALSSAFPNYAPLDYAFLVSLSGSPVVDSSRHILAPYGADASFVSSFPIV